MAGLLDFMNTPAGLGLLSAVAGGLAGARKGTPINSLGRGMATGLVGYNAAVDNERQLANTAIADKYRTMQMQEIEQRIKDQQAMREAGQAAAGAARPMETVYAPTGNTSPLMPNLSGGTDAIGDYSNMGVASPVEFTNAPQQRQSQFDPALYQNKMYEQLTQRGLHDAASKYAPKPEEYGTTPFVADDGTVRLIGKTGSTKELPFKGAPKEGASPYGQDLREWFAVNGIDPRTATPQQLQAGYNAVGQKKDNRAKLGGVNIGPTTIMAEGAADRAGKKIGDIVGESTATIEGQYGALDAVQGALEQLDAGIHTGYWANAKMNVSKATSGALGDREKAARTEKFKSYIGNTVIPRLKEFGGNDSVEELRMLERVMGGDITLEPEALKEILKQIELKQLRSIDRARRNQSAIESGQVPSTDPGPGRSPIGSVRKFNPATGRIE